MARKKRKVHAGTLTALVRDIRKDRPLDRRTAVAKTLGSIRDQLDGDLEEAARALLLADASAASLICQVALRKAMGDANMIDDAGLPCMALQTFAKFSAVKRSSLLALSRFKDKSGSSDPAPRDPENLGDLIEVNVDSDPESDRSNAEPSVKARDQDQDSDS